MNYSISKIKGFSYIAVVLLLTAVASFAQSNTGTITGQVQDANGAIIPNATVTVTNVGTSETKTVNADANGIFTAPSLSNGVYKVRAAASGFQEATVTDARLTVGETLRVNVTMTVQGVAATVTVADQTPTNTETSTIGDTIRDARIQDNPVNGRDFTQLLATVPGSVQTTNQFQTAINGIPSTFGGSSVLVDGIDAGRVDLNGTSNVLGRIESRVNRVSMDSIQEVQVLEQNYSAQYGDAIGAVINPITKSGTNTFHGSAFEFFRNEALDSDDFFAGKQKFRLNQFGGNVSGPIAKDKLFFFANYEGVRQTRGIQFTNVLVPTAAFRAEFSPTIAPAFASIPLPNTHLNDPSTTDPDNDGIDEVDGYTAQRDGTLREDTGSVKIDWFQTPRSQFSVRYNINDSKTIVPYGVGTDQIAPGTLTVQLFKASNNYTLSSNSVNEFAFGINSNDTSPSAGPSTLPRFDFSFINPFYGAPGPAQFNQIRGNRVYQFLDTFSFVHGNHSLKAGVDIRLNRRSAESIEQDTLTFFGVNDIANNAPFIISRNGNPRLDYANENYGFFFQDDWKTTSRLALNLGLRYDVSSVSREKHGLLQNFDLTTLSYTPPGQKVYDADTNNFGPRFGFAYDLFGKQKTVLRGGYGIFYNRELPASWGSPQANSFPQTSVNVFQWFGTFFGLCNGGSTFQYPVDPLVFNCGVASAFAVEKNLQTAMAQQWSLNVQQDLGFGTLQVGYVGNHVTHILTDGVVSPRNLNRADPVTTARPLTDAFGDIFLVGGYPSSNYNAMQVTFRRNMSKGLRFNANYTWSHAIDNIAGFFKDYQNEFDINADRASSDADVRHNFTLDAGYDLAFRDWFGSGPLWIVDGWTLNSIVQIRSGLPVNVNVQGGVFGGFSFRPDVVAGVDPYNPTTNGCSGYSVPNCQFNPAAFSIPGPGIFGNAGRNLLRGPTFAQVDLSIGKNTKLTERTSLQLRMDIFNLLNRANFADPAGGLSCTGAVGVCTGFGQSFATVGNQLGGLLGFGGPRQIQLSARFNF